MMYSLCIIIRYQIKQILINSYYQFITIDYISISPHLTNFLNYIELVFTIINTP